MATEQHGGSYTWRQGLLLYKGRVIVRTWGNRFYWHGMHRSVQDYVKGCAVAKNKSETLARWLLQSLPIPCNHPLPQNEKFMEAFSSFTACPIQLLVIGTQSSSRTFGRNFSRCRAPNYSLARIPPISGWPTEVINRCWPRDGATIYLRRNLVNLERSVNRMKQMADRKRRDISFEVGEQLPAEARVHPVFHVSLLKRYQDNGDLRDPTSRDPTFHRRRSGYLGASSYFRLSGSSKEPNLSKKAWCAGSIFQEEATWEPTNTLQEMFPNLDLEDKGPLDGGGIDRPRLFVCLFIILNVLHLGRSSLYLVPQSLSSFRVYLLSVKESTVWRSLKSLRVSRVPT
ncbi:hypothetical protein AAG906_016386 [Vitis piasezkii]